MLTIHQILLYVVKSPHVKTNLDDKPLPVLSVVDQILSSCFGVEVWVPSSVTHATHVTCVVNKFIRNVKWNVSQVDFFITLFMYSRKKRIKQTIDHAWS